MGRDVEGGWFLVLRSHRFYQPRGDRIVLSCGLRIDESDVSVTSGYSIATVGRNGVGSRRASAIERGRGGSLGQGALAEPTVSASANAVVRSPTRSTGRRRRRRIVDVKLSSLPTGEGNRGPRTSSTSSAVWSRVSQTRGLDYVHALTSGGAQEGALLRPVASRAAPGEDRFEFPLMRCPDSRSTNGPF